MFWRASRRHATARWSELPPLLPALHPPPPGPTHPQAQLEAKEREHFKSKGISFEGACAARACVSCACRVVLPRTVCRWHHAPTRVTPPHRASSLSPPPHTHTRARARHATTTDLRKQDLELLEAAPPDESGRGGGGRGAALMPYAKDADDADADADDDDSDSSSDVSVPVAWACACACALGTAVRRLVRARGGGDDTRAGTQVSGGAHAPSAQPRCQDTHVRQRQRHRTTAATTRRS
jgi:hypothetical protein